MADTIEQDVARINAIDSVRKILEVVCRITGLGFSAVARVTDTRWVACAVHDEISFGLMPGGELKLDTTICHEIRAAGRPVAIDHVAEDADYCGHPTPKLYGFQSYISVPIKRRNGDLFGTLCAIDPKPARLKNAETLGMFSLFADLIATHIDAHDRVIESESALRTERDAAALRDQFIAVLGHDLRNPLSAIGFGVEELRLSASSDEDLEVMAMIQRSAARMTVLIDNVLDFARGRLGGGLSVNCQPEPGLDQILNQVIDELRTAWRARTIDSTVRIDQLVSCDGSRIGQVLSNLLANALAHGSATSPVIVHAVAAHGMFEITVENRGQTIPPHVIANLFKPFARGTAKPGQQGLGLGLYIASQIAQSHGGMLTVVSADDRTRFTFQMPL